MEEMTVREHLAAQAIGMEVLRALHREEVRSTLLSATESRALRALEEIRRVLDDDGLADPECFRRIEAIIRIFNDNAVPISRHDW